MPTEITIPRLGWSMEEGTFVNWLKREGEWVAKGDQLFILESEKATEEIESFDEGVLTIPANAPRPGETVKVGQVIGFLLAKNESPPSVPQGDSPSDTNGNARDKAPAGPGVRRLARQLNVDLDAVAGSGPRGRIMADDVQVQAAHRTSISTGPSLTSGPSHKSHGQPPTSLAQGGSTRKIVITPRARRVARELGVDPTNLVGTGNGGRVREQDVRAAAQAPPRPAEREQHTKPQTTRSGSIRRTIARRMVESHLATAPVTLTSRADATNLVNLRQQFQAGTDPESGIVPAITDFLVKLVAIALERHPRLNWRWQEDGILEIPQINIGIACDTAAGLLVPVLRDARHLGVRQIAVRSRELVDRARRGALTTADLQGGTFTLSNLGMYGIDAFTPIINPPEAAILGIGAIRREPVYVDADRLVPRDLMSLSLTFDHRIVDGAPAARFLQTLVQGIENPAAWLME